jgi:hypothetical protein
LVRLTLARVAVVSARPPELLGIELALLVAGGGDGPLIRVAVLDEKVS